METIKLPKTMKKIFNLLFIVMPAVFTLTGCSKETAPGDSSNEGDEVVYELSFTGEKPALDDDDDNTPTSGTRTVFVPGEDTEDGKKTGTVQWNQAPGVEKILVTYHVFRTEGTDAFNTSPQVSEAGVVNTGGKSATFKIKGYSGTTLQKEYRFYAIYPGTISASVNGTGIITTSIPTTQNPEKESFDANADILLGKADDSFTTINAGVIEPVVMTYKRKVAHGCVTLTNLPIANGETIRSVTFTAPSGTPLTGNVNMSFTGMNISNTASAVNNVTLNYTDVIPDYVVKDTNGKNMQVWFCSIPFEIKSGSPFKVSVTTNAGVYTRTINANSKGISFMENRYNTLSINMSGTGSIYMPLGFAPFLDGDATNGHEANTLIMSQTLEDESVYAWLGELKNGRLYIPAIVNKGKYIVPANVNSDLSDSNGIATEYSYADTEWYWDLPADGEYRIVLNTKTKKITIYSPAEKLEPYTPPAWNHTQEPKNEAYSAQILNLWMWGGFGGSTAANIPSEAYKMSPSLANPRIFVYYTGINLPRQTSSNQIGYIKFLADNSWNNVYAYGAPTTQNDNTNTYTGAELNKTVALQGGQSRNRYSFYLIPEGCNIVVVDITDEKNPTVVFGQK